MKTFLKIIVVILIAYGVYRAIDKQWAQELFDRVQSIFQSSDTPQQEQTSEESELPEITVPESSGVSSSVSSENTLVLDYIFEWTDDEWTSTTGKQQDQELESEEEGEQENPETETETPEQEDSQEDTPSSPQWLTADDYRDLERLWQNLVE